MNSLDITNNLFFTQTALDRDQVSCLTQQALNGSDDGEIFLEYSESETLRSDNGIIKSSDLDVKKGFGLRLIKDAATGYACSSSFDLPSLKLCRESARQVLAGYEGAGTLAPLKSQAQHYGDENPLHAWSTPEKIKLLSDVEEYAFSRDPRVHLVSVILSSKWQAIQIIREDGTSYADIRPLVRLNVRITMRSQGRSETGSYSGGGRMTLKSYCTSDIWRGAVDEAIRQAGVNLESIPAPVGEMPIVLGPGWPGILLHEAVGHGLEGDFVRKKSSIFTGLMGQRIAAPGVTVIDDGTLPNARGSLTIDDEGTPGSHTPLIENGIIVGLMHDRLSARQLGVQATGNGRRQSYAHRPQPRMTNTFMLSGAYESGEVISSVKRGIYAPGFAGGDIDIVSGNFTFSSCEAYLIEDGKIGPSLKDAVIAGNGAAALLGIKMVGNNGVMDPGMGSCGKYGQNVPVGVGQPTLRIDGLLVGGTSSVTT